MRKNRRGFTLMELQVASLVMGLILVAAISIYIFSWRSFTTGNTVLDIYSNSRIAMGWMSKDIRWASQILPQSTIIGGYTTSSNCAVLQVPSISGSGGNMAIIPSQYDEIIYYVQNGDLYQIVAPYTSGSTPSVRPAQNRVVARNCNPATFYKVDTANGTWTPLSTFISSGGNLSTVSNLGISLPVNETTLSLSGAVVRTTSVTPTTVIRLRNR
jgi:prepilin-type N-terminal cleavage/methylation domain-containing protein